MTRSDIQAWAKSGKLGKEQMAAFWTWFYCQEHKTLPRMKELLAGVHADYGVSLDYATASRGREAALTLIMSRAFSPGETSVSPPSFP